MSEHSVERGAHQVVRALARAGVRRLFSLSGHHIMPIYDALIDSGVALVHVRHEAAAVHMADACARVSGEVGVALVTGGPGHANACAALYPALLAESPVVLLSGHAPLGQLGRGAFQEMRQVEMAATVCKAAWLAQSAEGLATDIARAVALARSGRPGPVHVSLPVDLLTAALDPDATLSAIDEFEPPPIPIAAEEAEHIGRALTEARHPLVLIGPGLLTRQGRTRMALLESAMGVPVVGLQSPRGIDDPALGRLRALLPEVDCALLLGKRLDFAVAFGGAPFAADCRWLQIDCDSAERAHARDVLGTRLEVSVDTVDIPTAIDRLLAASVRLAIDPTRHARWLEAVRTALASRAVSTEDRTVGSGRLHPAQFLAPFARLLVTQPDAVFVADGGEFGQWAQATLEAPHRLINGMAGGIGASIPMALGARAALGSDRRSPVIAAVGDGGFGFHASELDTAGRHDLPVIVLIGNDARWNAEHQMQLREYGPDRTLGCELRPTRYDQVAAAFGVEGLHVTDADSLARAVAAAERAIAAGRSLCINAMIESVPAPRV
ncbi:MAG: thiamine pyrophosphate-binding protein [Casimicrobiaceae bacterium]